ncbi:MAG: adenylyltransferase/cytidyltransferase family protein [Clostridia bacterium]|nr:adenylyltransferase/cytidyltransferase family protein [Clostridia bacterium]MBR2175548.1 adenylyltransferase/cytidyltransferase family protein [Clostridia bacterium]
MKKYKKGYTQGVYDMFHIGHLNLINNAKQFCEYLIVAVNSDELVKDYKHKTPIIPQEERRYIIENIKAVDEAVIAHTLDKVRQLKAYGFDVIFIGDDWKGNPRWEETKRQLAEYGVDVVFLPHTDGVCSTDLREVEREKIDEDIK